MEERIRRVKVMKDSGIGEVKFMCTCKLSQGINSPLPRGRQVFNHSQENFSQPHITMTWEDKNHHSKFSPIPSPSPCIICSAQCHCSIGLSLESAGVTCPSCVPSQILVHPQPVCWWGGVRWGAEKSLTLCKLCSTIIETSLGYLLTLCSAQIPNSTPYQLLKEN